MSDGIDKGELRKVCTEPTPVHHPKEQTPKADAGFKAEQEKRQPRGSTGERNRNSRPAIPGLGRGLQGRGRGSIKGPIICSWPSLLAPKMAIRGVLFLIVTGFRLAVTAEVAGSSRVVLARFKRAEHSKVDETST